MAQHSDHTSKLDPEFEQAVDISLLAVPDLPDEETITMMRQVTASFSGHNKEYFEPLIPDSKLPSFTLYLRFIIKNITTKESYRVIDHQVPVKGGEITVRVVIPSGNGEEKFPLLIYFHGGGNDSEHLACVY
jgi:acetyl esterase/lipase